MQERQQQGESEKIVVDDSTDEEPDLGKTKKYENGKPKRELKIQLTYQQEEQMEKLPKQRGKKQ
jgi:hypothetical protein